MLTIKEAADKLGISENTVRRRLHAGLLRGYQEDPPYGRWVVELSEEDIATARLSAVDGVTPELVAALRDTIRRQGEALEQFSQQLESKDKQIEQLHVLLQQVQAALPAPRDGRPWWQRWLRG
ncbi:MAG TPA: helix-turn-helix domain-containing protein [Dehalococcoidia bacterium]|jgi:DNA-binding Lrp family transcriptional regulator|nr:helix-turn-helix domain-containing protein [Dehalococcoidia bacterium]